MRRGAAILAALAIAGCGGGDGDRDDAPAPTATPRGERLDEAERALRELEDSDLPEDARRELEEAKRLLDEGSR